MTVAQEIAGDQDRSAVVELDDARGDVRRRRADPLDEVLVCGSCLDREAAPRAVVHASGNPWLTKLVCSMCGAPWSAERVPA